MALDWMPRDDEKKNHSLHENGHWGSEAPCVVFEKKPLQDPSGKTIDGLYTAWIRLNNPRQYNSYTTEMVKGVIAGFENASLDRSVVAVVFTGTGPYAFCTGGNTKEYSEYYSRRPEEYGQYMELFNHMVDAILACKSRLSVVSTGCGWPVVRKSAWPAILPFLQTWPFLGRPVPNTDLPLWVGHPTFCRGS